MERIFDSETIARYEQLMAVSNGTQSSGEQTSAMYLPEAEGDSPLSVSGDDCGVLWKLSWRPLLQGD